MKYIFTTIIFTFISLFSSAQYSIAWSKIIGGAGDDVAKACIETTLGDFVIVGYTKSTRNEQSDLWVVKLSKTGNLIWEKRFGGAGYDFAYDVDETVNKELIIVGSTQSKGAGGHDFWVLKLDVNGNLLWDKTFGGTDHDFANAVEVTSDGGIAVAGYTKSKGLGFSDFWILKLDKFGTLTWDKTFGGANFDEATDILETFDKQFLVAGYTSSKGNGEHDFWILKISANGQLVWEETYGGSNHDLAYDIHPSLNGGYYVTGKTSSQGHGNSDIWVCELDVYGKKIWGQVYGRSGSDAAFAITQTFSGELLLGGYSMTTNDGYDIQILNIGERGEIIWNQNFGGIAWDEAYDLIATSDYGALAVGYTKENTSGKCDMWIAKLKPDFEVFPDFQLISDVDKNIPYTIAPASNTYAVIIGIENYKNISEAIYAERDAQLFYQITHRTLGVPGNNIYYVSNENATSAEFFRIFGPNGWLEKHANQNSDIIIYYAGHGLADVINRKSVLLPYDVNTTYPNGFAIEDIVKKLDSLKTNSVTMFFDACFAGLSREQQLISYGVRAVQPSGLFSNSEKFAIFSSCQGLEFSKAFKEQQHGLFSYYLIKGIRGEARGIDNEISVQELYRYVNQQVKTHSLTTVSGPQTPEFTGKNFAKIITKY